MKDSEQEKRETLDRMLSEEHVLVHIAPHAIGVALPEHLQRNPTVTLKLSRHFRGRMTISPTEVSAELLFGERYFTCKVPFAAVWGMTSMRGQFLMWPESAPAEVLATLEQQAQARKADALAAEAEELGAADVTPIDGAGAGSTPSATSSSDTAAKPKERPKLRRIK